MADKINVLHLSTHDEECGIATYQQNIVDAMGDRREINNVFFDISPNKLKRLKGEAFTAALNQLLSQLQDFDILHIQHEYSFYNDNHLQRIVDGAKAQSKKVLFTLHTPPHAREEESDRHAKPSLHPRSLLHYLRAKILLRRFIRTHINPLRTADRLIVPNHTAKDSFVSYGLPERLFTVIELPVPEVNLKVKSQIISQALHKTTGDIILSTVGFLSAMKGTIPAVKMLNFLPDNYKLAIIGGSHPSGQNDKYYDKVCDTIIELGLQKRVYITGYVETDDERDALLRETDICLYPYQRKYYDYVSSAALNNAVANDLPIVAYETYTFLELNDKTPFITFTHSANYYEMARAIQRVDIQDSVKLTKQYAELYSIDKQARRFADCYHELLTN